MELGAKNLKTKFEEKRKKRGGGRFVILIVS